MNFGSRVVPTKTSSSSKTPDLLYEQVIMKFRDKHAENVLRKTLEAPSSEGEGGDILAGLLAPAPVTPVPPAQLAEQSQYTEQCGTTCSQKRLQHLLCPCSVPAQCFKGGQLRTGAGEEGGESPSSQASTAFAVRPS